MLELTPGPNDDLVDLWDEDKSLSSLRYGNWRSSKTGRYLLPAGLSGSDYSGSLVEKSNLRAWEEEFGDGDGEWWTNTPGGHGTYALVIDTQNVPEDLNDKVVEFLNAVYSYPVVDETLMGEMELESQAEAWDNWARSDFESALEKEFDVEFDKVDGDKLYELFREACNSANEYWVNESGGESYINVKRVVARGKITEEDLDALGATYLQEKYDHNGPGFYIAHGARPRRSEEKVYKSFKAAEEDAFDVYNSYDHDENTPQTIVIEARSRADALAGKGHAWWIDGLTRGPAVDPRQLALPLRKRSR